jgi:hypothetical protein
MLFGSRQLSPVMHVQMLHGEVLEALRVGSSASGL